MKFILYRPGKNALGPFDTYTKAIGHMAVERLMGYSIVPMESPDAKDQEVVVPEPPLTEGQIRIVDEYLSTMVSAFYWTGVGRERNARDFLSECVGAEPLVRRRKIPLIKALRLLSHNNGEEMSLKEAKDIVDDFFGRNSTGA